MSQKILVVLFTPLVNKFLLPKHAILLFFSTNTTIIPTVNSSSQIKKNPKIIKTNSSPRKSCAKEEGKEETKEECAKRSPPPSHPPPSRKKSSKSSSSSRSSSSIYHATVTSTLGTDFKHKKKESDLKLKKISDLKKLPSSPKNNSSEFDEEMAKKVAELTIKELYDEIIDLSSASDENSPSNAHSPSNASSAGKVINSHSISSSHFSCSENLLQKPTTHLNQQQQAKRSGELNLNLRNNIFANSVDARSLSSNNSTRAESSNNSTRAGSRVSEAVSPSSVAAGTNTNYPHCCPNNNI